MDLEKLVPSALAVLIAVALSIALADRIYTAALAAQVYFLALAVKLGGLKDVT